MKKNWLIFLLTLVAFGCGPGTNVPNISGIKVNFKLERFEKSFFSIDSNNIAPGLIRVRTEFPDFYPDFMQNILGVNGSNNDSTTLAVTRNLLSSYTTFAADLENKFSNTVNLEKNIKTGCQYVKYYFPDYKIPGFITFIGPLDAPGVALTRTHIAIGLQQYAGKDFPGYQTIEVKTLYPSYISRRFDPVYIPANCMKLMIDDLFPDKSPGRPLIEQMIEKGKQWWLLDKFLPEAADSVKTGYTQKQLDWCRKNEGLIWNYFIAHENIESIEPDVIQNYIGEGPSTQQMSDASPGNIGPWVGWQIVKKFTEKNSSLTPGEVMNTPARKILAEAKYKPK